MQEYKDKYRSSSLRLQSWDYRCNGVYFITICCKDKAYYFGDIVDGKMHQSNIGVIADILWHEIKHHSQNIELDEFVVMPNHIHGILVINNSVETLHDTSLQQSKTMSDISPKANSISSIIRSYKPAVTKHAHRLGYEFKWQSRFYDHIIRNEVSLNQIQQYMINNPQNWKDDEFYPQD